MGTFVTIHVVGRGPAPHHSFCPQEAVERAFDWFQQIEACCSRFNPQSELMQLCAHTGVEIPVSPILYEVVQFALAVAEESSGAFDPTVGHAMEALGFNSEYRSGNTIHTALAPAASGVASVSYQDVRLDPERRTIRLLQPMILDLGGAAKGFAVDMAARELETFQDFAIDAGGDLYLGGLNPQGEAWNVGIRHPRRDNELIDCVRVSGKAVCTSGDYERRSPDGGGHHILDPRTEEPAPHAASVTVVAPTAMLADALGTAAFVLGPAEGIRLFDRLGVDGLIFSAELERYATEGLCHA